MLQQAACPSFVASIPKAESRFVAIVIVAKQDASEYGSHSPLGPPFPQFLSLSSGIGITSMADNEKKSLKSEIDDFFGGLIMIGIITAVCYIFWEDIEPFWKDALAIIGRIGNSVEHALEESGGNGGGSSSITRLPIEISGTMRLRETTCTSTSDGRSLGWCWKQEGQFELTNNGSRDYVDVVVQVDYYDCSGVAERNRSVANCRAAARSFFVCEGIYLQRNTRAGCAETVYTLGDMPFDRHNYIWTHTPVQ